MESDLFSPRVVQQKDTASIRPDYYKQPCSSTAIHVVEVLTGHDTHFWGECFDLIGFINADYFTGAAIKYLWRCQKKGYYRDDLVKARTHLVEAESKDSIVKAIAMIDKLLEVHDEAKSGGEVDA